MVCFHKPDEPNGYLSNWYLEEFILDNIKFTSMEQYMMYSKAILFNDKKTADKILTSNNCGKIKSLGREVHNFNDKIWDKNKKNIVIKGLMAKFEYNLELRNELLKTGNKILVECAVGDRIWGIGLGMKDEKRFDVEKWRGQNLLGQCLMIVREQLREKYA